MIFTGLFLGDIWEDGIPKLSSLVRSDTLICADAFLAAFLCGTNPNGSDFKEISSLACESSVAVNNSFSLDFLDFDLRSDVTLDASPLPAVR